jgi:hypothetical protein
MPQPSEITVYLSVCSESQSSLRNELSKILQRAGMKVIPENSIYDHSSVSQIPALLSKASCSVHIVFPEYTPKLDSSDLSLAEYQFNQGKESLTNHPESMMFIWMPPSTTTDKTDRTQSEFITEIRNNIVENMVFSTARSPIQLVDNILALMEMKENEKFDLNTTDVFLISNQLDEKETNAIVEMLSDIVSIEKLNIIQDSETDYTELCKQQIAISKLAVIYFKESADWAIPFAQQVWSKIGGATSHTPIVLIGDKDPETNKDKKLKAPKVISLIISGELIPLEIKVQYDKLVEPK